MPLVWRETLFGQAKAFERARASWCGERCCLVRRAGVFGVGVCANSGVGSLSVVRGPWLRLANKPYKPYKPYKPRASWCGKQGCLVSVSAQIIAPVASHAVICFWGSPEGCAPPPLVTAATSPSLLGSGTLPPPGAVADFVFS